MSSIFITGATGYIGGSVFSRLLQNPKLGPITALVRSEEKAATLKASGAIPVVGSYKDLGLLTELASKADLVIAVADCDNADAAQAILDGLKLRYQRTGVAPALIHTSGTGVLLDKAHGARSTDTVYSDLDIPQIDSLPLTQIHRPVDVLISRAGSEGQIKTYIILPPIVYGEIVPGIVADSGLQNKHSLAVSTLVKASVDRGRAGMVGQGKNYWGNIHVQDLADLYATLVDAIVAGRDSVGNGLEGFYFAVNGESPMYDISKEIGRVMLELGKTEDAEPTTFTEEEGLKYFFGLMSMFGGNSRSQAPRSHALGWKPTRTFEGYLGLNVRSEIEETYAEKAKQTT